VARRRWRNGDSHIAERPGEVHRVPAEGERPAVDELVRPFEDDAGSRPHRPRPEPQSGEDQGHPKAWPTQAGQGSLHDTTTCGRMATPRPIRWAAGSGMLPTARLRACPRTHPELTFHDGRMRRPVSSPTRPTRRPDSIARSAGSFTRSRPTPRCGRLPAGIPSSQPSSTKIVLSDVGSCMGTSRPYPAPRRGDGQRWPYAAADGSVCPAQDASVTERQRWPCQRSMCSSA
jgi:hypothetical protein